MNPYRKGEGDDVLEAAAAHPLDVLMFRTVLVVYALSVYAWLWHEAI